jgi:polyhydroxyalkanoate synthesis regulator phasin
MKKILASIAIVVSLGVGAVGISALVPAGASLRATTATTEPAKDAATERSRHISGPLQDALDSLVADGTLDQKQADAVAARVKDARGDRHMGRRPMLALAAKAIGIDSDALADEIKAGKTVATVAKAHKVDPDVVIKAIVDATSKRVDQAVDKGRLDADRAATVKERLAKAAEHFVNQTARRKHR